MLYRQLEPSKFKASSLEHRQEIDSTWQELYPTKLTLDEVEDIRDQKLVLHYPCQTQAVERRIKVVSESASQVIGFPRRNGLI